MIDILQLVQLRPEVQKELACIDRSLPPGTFELERREQILMVLVR